MTIEINATNRKAQGTGASRRLRHAGRVPGVVYGVGEVNMIEMDHNELYHKLRAETFHASVLTLVLDGKKESVMLRDFVMHRSVNKSNTSTFSVWMQTRRCTSRCHCTS